MKWFERFHPRQVWHRWGKPVLLVLALSVLLRCFAIDLNRVAGRSMQPTLCDGDRIVTNKLAYGVRLPFTDAWPLRWANPQRGDVVVFTSPVDGKRLVKRVVGVPGALLDDGFPPGTTVPPGHYYVAGDNPGHSLDSRTFGCVPRERIGGRVVGIAFSFHASGTGSVRSLRR